MPVAGDRVIVDLSALDFIDCCALGGLLRVRESARTAGGDVLLAAPQKLVQPVLDLRGAADMLYVLASVPAAAASTGRCAVSHPASARGPEGRTGIPATATECCLFTLLRSGTGRTRGAWLGRAGQGQEPGRESPPCSLTVFAPGECRQSAWHAPRSRFSVSACAVMRCALRMRSLPGSRNGWTAKTEVNFVDVCARRGDERLYAEAKGRTAAIGLDVDTLYGQLLRRMADPGTGARYAVVVPTAAVRQPYASRPGSVNGWTSKCTRLKFTTEVSAASLRHSAVTGLERISGSLVLWPAV